ncbi:Glycogen recognition site of AMP-activated protein kinase [Desulfatibacillum alkenivorans DSM 16219]|jgi:1,4-alpha-glucan branching enzyme|uniref:Glycogen recognition site of AMP-activated protein kinase n=1 Tax=Desulfatibacillum alkenivorans DSM 16219 TaxID=1121393 RepID=A0A1M6YQ44_9BACT|nr:glycogen-binding domain-containing protein [Desulfatibacillum alkenivorans]SHL20386.1 Glycogen recognition site of AMP-activated protein kinase [Desulfatibacillum alkenivorans DSM 16219]
MAKKKMETGGKTKSAKNASAKKRVTFFMRAPEAKEVSVAGDFNGWDAKKHPMKLDKTGLWKKIVMVAPGRCEYKFLVDGDWALNPDTQETCTNEFGTENHVLEI